MGPSVYNSLFILCYAGHIVTCASSFTLTNDSHLLSTLALPTRLLLRSLLLHLATGLVLRTLLLLLLLHAVHDLRVGRLQLRVLLLLLLLLLGLLLVMLGIRGIAAGAAAAAAGALLLSRGRRLRLVNRRQRRLRITVMAVRDLGMVGGREERDDESQTHNFYDFK